MKNKNEEKYEERIMAQERDSTNKAKKGGKKGRKMKICSAL
jgi:hypothetical protein